MGTIHVGVTKARKAEKARKLLARLKQPTSTNQLIFFSDEKNFTRTRKLTTRTISDCVQTQQRSRSSCQ